MIRKHFFYTAFFVLSACFAASLVLYISTDRLSFFPNSIFNHLFVPKAWQPKAMQGVGVVSEYIWSAQDGTKPEMLHIKLRKANSEAFSKRMTEQGFKLDVEQSQPPTLSTWVKGDSVVQSNIGLPCDRQNSCERFIVVLE